MSEENKDDKDWKKELTGEEFEVLRNKGTEPPFSGEHFHNKEKGIYQCKACGNELFSSDTKYESGSGWPSFYDALDKDKIELRSDTSHGMDRTEVVCRKCGSHLGHVFDDGPKEKTGKRYCINSIALDFDPE